MGVELAAAYERIDEKKLALRVLQDMDRVLRFRR
jgi:hypothetical protein